MKTDKEILVNAKEKISDPLKWNKDGSYYKDDNYSCMCVMGAVAKSVGDRNDILSPEDLEGNEYAIYVDIQSKLNQIVTQNTGMVGQPFEFVVDYNDHPDTTHDEIMKLMDKAIAECPE